MTESTLASYWASVLLSCQEFKQLVGDNAVWTKYLVTNFLSDFRVEMDGREEEDKFTLIFQFDENDVMETTTIRMRFGASPEQSHQSIEWKDDSKVRMSNRQWNFFQWVVAEGDSVQKQNIAKALVAKWKACLTASNLSTLVPKTSRPGTPSKTAPKPYEQRTPRKGKSKTPSPATTPKRLRLNLGATSPGGNASSVSLEGTSGSISNLNTGSGPEVRPDVVNSVAPVPNSTTDAQSRPVEGGDTQQPLDTAARKSTQSQSGSTDGEQDLEGLDSIAPASGGDSSPGASSGEDDDIPDAPGTQPIGESVIERSREKSNENTMPTLIVTENGVHPVMQPRSDPVYNQELGNQQQEENNSTMSRVNSPGGNQAKATPSSSGGASGASGVQEQKTSPLAPANKAKENKKTPLSKSPSPLIQAKKAHKSGKNAGDKGKTVSEDKWNELTKRMQDMETSHKKEIERLETKFNELVKVVVECNTCKTASRSQGLIE